MWLLLFLADDVYRELTLAEASKKKEELDALLCQVSPKRLGIFSKVWCVKLICCAGMHFHGPLLFLAKRTNGHHMLK